MLASASNAIIMGSMSMSLVQIGFPKKKSDIRVYG